MTRDWDLILVGAGLANGLIAWRLQQCQPHLRVLLIERDAQPGGNHTWSFHRSDLSAAQLAWLAPLVNHRWDGYTVRFPHYQRAFPGGYCSISSRHFAECLQHHLPVLCNAEVLRLTPSTVQLTCGTTYYAPAVIDGRGQPPTKQLQLGYQAFVGQEWELPHAHGLQWPVLMDATVEQGDGYRFVYTLPLATNRLLIEDTRYVNQPRLDTPALRAAIDAYRRSQGWAGGQLLREEHGCLPITLSGQFEALCAEQQGIACSGLQAGLFHPTTGYSLPSAVHLAELIAEHAPLPSDALLALIQQHARGQWQRQRFFRVLNRMLFLAGKPHERWQVMQRFYRLPQGLIERFYAGEPSWLDKARLLSGKPPVPLGQALRAILKQGLGPQVPT